MYEDEVVTVYMGFDFLNRLQMHAKYHTPVTGDVIKYSKEVLEGIEEGLKSKGVSEYFTLVDSVEAYKYCKLLGFRTTLETIKDKYEYMKKVIA